ncbi:MAG TPA: hypothetical protein VFJ22_06545 [Dermatophilaceae bacterium]|nr:hypothetical protein [Dermatophilaceae bacterium]
MGLVEMSGLSGLPELSGLSELSRSDLSWAAVDACTLPTVERPVRAAEFDTLFEEVVEEVIQVDDTHLVVRLAGGPEVAARASALAAKETACCSFFSFRVVEETEGEAGTRPGQQAGNGAFGHVRLEVDVPPERAAVLSGLAARAEASLGRLAP